MIQAFRPAFLGLILTPTVARAKRTLSLSVLWWCVSLSAAVQAAIELRVAVEQQAESVVIGSSTPATVRDANGNGVGQLSSDQAVAIEAEGDSLRLADWRGQAFWVEPGDGGFIFIDDSWYRGRVLLVPVDGRVTAVNWVDLEVYLYSVLGGEMHASWPQEALKAQAVAARSYALYRREQTGNSLYDVGADTGYQVYKGLADESPATQAAVRSTQGQVLTYGSGVIEAVFHSSSGGYTENVEDIWQRPVPYLRSVPDFDQSAPVYYWSETFSADQFQKRVVGIGQLQQAIPERTTPRGRVVSMRLEGTDGTRVITGTDLRRALNLRSTLFTITIAGDTIRVDGRGFGHGIGMSQWGAWAMAQQGYSYQQILSHYYQGTVLSQLRVANLP
jgi:stage II sporulation protein D